MLLKGLKGPDRALTSFQQVGTNPIERWYVGGLIGSLAPITGTPSIDTIRAFPLLFTRGGTIDRIAINVTTELAGNARLGIYKATNNINLYPGSLIADSGALSTSTTGVKAAVLDVKLQPNELYWLAHLGSSAATLRGLSVGNCYPIFGIDSALSNALGIGIGAAQAYGALPANFPAGGTIITAAPIPVIAVRFSA